MKKILILTAGFGDGHNAAARNLRDAIEMADEDARAEVIDLFADSYGAFNTLARKTYLGMVAYAPKLWGQFYSLLESPLVEKQSAVLPGSRRCSRKFSPKRSRIASFPRIRFMRM